MAAACWTRRAAPRASSWCILYTPAHAAWRRGSVSADSAQSARVVDDVAVGEGLMRVLAADEMDGRLSRCMPDVKSRSASVL